MMNPYLQFPPEKAEQKRMEMNEELAAQANGQLARNASAKQANVSLWIGNLLIRMGKKLTEREIDLKTSKEHA